MTAVAPPNSSVLSSTLITGNAVDPHKINRVIVHPLVLLSVVDHYHRLDKVTPGDNKRVVGILLGALRKNVLDISNSFAVPFEEDQHDKSVWFLDHDYLENMFNMFKKVNARERIVGWYHSGPKLCQNDIAINELIKRYNPNSILVIVDVKLNDIQGLPTEAYIAVEEVHDDGTPTTKTFDHLPSEIGAEEAEEVGVEHLLRDIKDTTISTLSQRITAQLSGLKGLEVQLKEIYSYLQLVIDKKLPINHQIIYQLQDMFNLLPDVSLHNFVKSTYSKTNDELVVVYLASVIRSVLALDDLINNKVTNRETERAGDGLSTTNTTAATSANKDKDKDKDKEKPTTNGDASAKSSNDTSDAKK